MKSKKIFILMITVLLCTVTIPFSATFALEKKPSDFENKLFVFKDEPSVFKDKPLVFEEKHPGFDKKVNLNFGAVKCIKSYSISFKKTSARKAKAIVKAHSNGYTPYIKSKISLQIYSPSENEYITFGSPSTKTVKNSSITHIRNFTIHPGEKYRIKVQLTDKMGSRPVTKTYYKSLKKDRR